MKLEEFRKKKAADRAKKASSTSQIHASEVNSNEKQPLETEHARVTDTSGAGTSDLLGNAVTESSSLEINNDSNPIDAVQKSEPVLSSDRQTSIFSTNEYNSFSSDQTQKHANGHKFKKYGDLGSGGPLDVYQSHGEKGKSNDAENYTGDLGRLPYGAASDQFFALRSRGSTDFDSSINRLSLHGIDEPQLKEEKTPSKDYTIADASSQVSVVRISSQNSISSALQSEPSSASGSKSSSLYEGYFIFFTLGFDFIFQCFHIFTYLIIFANVYCFSDIYFVKEDTKYKYFGFHGRHNSTNCKQKRHCR